MAAAAACPRTLRWLDVIACCRRGPLFGQGPNDAARRVPATPQGLSPGQQAPWLHANTYAAHGICAFACSFRRAGTRCCAAASCAAHGQHPMPDPSPFRMPPIRFAATPAQRHRPSAPRDPLGIHGAAGGGRWRRARSAALNRRVQLNARGLPARSAQGRPSPP
eukprot:365226-Chlamydomonas_euryale.AAC.4